MKTIKNRIVVEVEGGMVAGIYIDNLAKTHPANRPEIFVVDLGGAQIGEGIYCSEIDPQPLEQAEDLVKDALTDGMGK